MKIMKIANSLLVALCVICLSSCSSNESGGSSIIDNGLPKEIAALPIGIEVVHRDDTVYASMNLDDPEERGMYKWHFETSVRSLDGSDLEMLEFGAYVWLENRWVFSTIADRPFTREEFADWYNCPYGEVRGDRSYTDHDNWSKSNNLEGGTQRALWYFIAKNNREERVLGYAEVYTIGKMQPNP